jgi:hypothetical protein
MQSVGPIARGEKFSTQVGPSARVGIRSPWTEGQLNKLVWSDIFGTQAQWITRAEAMTIPGVHKARSVLLALIADKPLTGFRDETELAEQPRWLYRSPGMFGPYQRMAQTIDDHIWYGWSLWARQNGTRDDILSAWRIPFELWQFDANGRILVVDEDGQFAPVDEDEVILIPGPSEGLIEYATRTLRGAAELEQAWVKRAKNPIPAIELHETIDSGILDSEAQEVVDAWAAARADPNGAIAYTPYSIEARALGQGSPDMFIEGRNASRIDIANFFALPASLIDGSLSTASLTYSTQEGRRNEVYDYSIPYWCRPIEDRLSQDDVTPAGTSIKFDFSRLLTTEQAPVNTTED